MSQDEVIIYWEGIGVIAASMLAVAGIIYKGLTYFYCKGKENQNEEDNIKDLKIRVSSLETELLNLQVDISRYRTEEAHKLDDIKEGQAQMKIDIAVIKTILKKAFPS